MKFIKIKTNKNKNIKILNFFIKFCFIKANI